MVSFKELSQSLPRSRCPVSCSLDIIGDKWSLLIIRDMLMLGSGQYQDFLKAPEGISTNILADRLKKLEQAGVITKEAYQKHPVRYAYSLTEMGQGLRPLLLEMVKWGGTYIEDAFLPSADQMKAKQEKVRKTG